MNVFPVKSNKSSYSVTGYVWVCTLSQLAPIYLMMNRLLCEWAKVGFSLASKRTQQQTYTPSFSYPGSQFSDVFNAGCISTWFMCAQDETCFGNICNFLFSHLDICCPLVSSLSLRLEPHLPRCGTLNVSTRGRLRWSAGAGQTWEWLPCERVVTIRASLPQRAPQSPRLTLYWKLYKNLW